MRASQPIGSAGGGIEGGDSGGSGGGGAAGGGEVVPQASVTTYDARELSLRGSLVVYKVTMKGRD